MILKKINAFLKTRPALLLNMAGTLAVLGGVDDNILKVCLLIPLWSLTLFNATKIEWILFGAINLFFIFSDYMAIQNGFFEFISPNLIGLPYFEFLIWGYYVLHAHKFLRISYPKKSDWKIIGSALVFSQLFGLVSDFTLLLYLTSGFLLGLLLLYRKKEDVIFVGYMCILGAAVELVGVTCNIWHYPDLDFQQSALQFIVMWGAVGFFFRRIAGPFLSKSNSAQNI